MATRKSNSRANQWSKKSRTTNKKSGALILCCSILFLLATTAVIFCFVFFNERTNSDFFDRIKNGGDSLIEGDESIYHDSLNIDHDNHNNTSNNPADKQRINADEKARFRAPSYDKNDQDYLNKKINTR